MRLITPARLGLLAVVWLVAVVALAFSDEAFAAPAPSAALLATPGTR